MISERSAIDLLEEAIALARRAPARAWTCYLAGAVPFFATLLFYTRATTGTLAVPEPAPWALVLCLLFAWRQYTRSLFGQILGEGLSETPATRNVGTHLGAAIRNWFAGLLRVLIPLPIPWLTAVFRNYQASAWEDASPFRRALAMAGQSGSEFIAWLLLGVMSLFIWINVFTGIIAVPTLYRIFTGEQGEMGRNISTLLNQTVALGSLMVAWCICDVVLEALHVVQRYYRESERTGADLLRAWRRAIAKSAAAATLALCLCISLKAQPAPQPALNKAIDEVLTQSQYQWRETPAPQPGEESAIVRWLRSIVDTVKHFVRSISRPLGDLIDRFLKWLMGRDRSSDLKGPGAPVSTLRFASFFAILFFAGILVALLMRSRSHRAKAQSNAVPAAPLPMDLNDPSIVATDLPEDQWLALAREWMEKGDTRMALRAWFLALLAFLNRRELVSISRHKSNLDYRRELARRARSFNGLDTEFTASVQRFESVWYGMYPLDTAGLEDFATGFERMRRLCS